MRLFVDDIRNAPNDEWIVVRTVTEAIRAIARFDFEEISLDHDISHQVVINDLSRPYPCKECFCAVAYFIGEHTQDKLRIPPKITIHTSNPVAADELKAILKTYGIDATIKLSGLTNRLEMEV